MDGLVLVAADDWRNWKSVECFQVLPLESIPVRIDLVPLVSVVLHLYGLIHRWQVCCVLLPLLRLLQCLLLLFFFLFLFLLFLLITYHLLEFILVLLTKYACSLFPLRYQVVGGSQVREFVLSDLCRALVHVDVVISF